MYRSLFRCISEIYVMQSKGEEELAGGLLASLQAALLLAVLMPVYTVQQGRKLLSYHALPVLRLLLEWAVAHPKVCESG